MRSGPSEENDAFDPVVTTDGGGTLHWAGNDHVLVVNGDLIDHGPANAACVVLVERLQREAPAGRVHYHIGNHELAILLPALVGWRSEYSVSLSSEERREFLERVADGAVTAAFEGDDYTYSHAGRNDPFDVGDERVQRRLHSRYADVLGIGDSHGGRGPLLARLRAPRRHRSPGESRIGQSGWSSIPRSSSTSPTRS